MNPKRKLKKQKMKTIRIALTTLITLFGVILLIAGIKTMMWHVLLMAALAFILGYSLLNEKEDVK